SPELTATHHGISTTGASHPTTDPATPITMVGTCPDNGSAATSAPVAAEVRNALRGGEPGHTDRHPHRLASSRELRLSRQSGCWSSGTSARASPAAPCTPVSHGAAGPQALAGPPGEGTHPAGGGIAIAAAVAITVATGRAPVGLAAALSCFSTRRSQPL